MQCLGQQQHCFTVCDANASQFVTQFKANLIQQRFHITLIVMQNKKGWDQQSVNCDVVCSYVLVYVFDVRSDSG